MCHNSVTENEQIDKCIENGMPHKIIKTIKYTMRKRANHEEDYRLKQQQLQQRKHNITEDHLLDNKSTKLQDTLTMEEEKPTNSPVILKCPFGHGSRLSSPAVSLNSFPTTPSSSSSSNINSHSNNDKFEFSDLFEKLPKISQLSTIFATDNHKDTNNDTSNRSNITNLNGHFDKASTEMVYNDDILAKSTQLTKHFTHNIQQALRRLQNSKIYTLLTKTAQPAHIIAICILSFVLFTVWPELIDGTSSSSAKQQTETQQLLQHLHHHQPEQILAKNGQGQNMSVRKNDMLALIAYLGAFSTHFGAQIWMTFVSGLSLYFSLPRHMFGQCQQILFPKYFAMNAVLSIMMLILYVKFFLNTWTLAKCIQLGSLALTGAIEVLVRLYLAPPLLRLMHEKYKIEGTIGSGKEVGSLVQGDLVQCPHYQRIHKAFRRVHMTVAIGNMITMLSSCLHLYYIAGQLQISIA